MIVHFILKSEMFAASYFKFIFLKFFMNAKHVFNKVLIIV
jgi:hypothetical protein